MAPGVLQWRVRPRARAALTALGGLVAFVGMALLLARTWRSAWPTRRVCRIGGGQALDPLAATAVGERWWPEQSAAATDPCSAMRASAAYARTTGAVDSPDSALEPLVFVHNEGSGLADNYAGSVAAFALALFLGRRFFLRYDAVLDLGIVRPAFPDWNWTGPALSADERFLGSGVDAFVAACYDDLPVALRLNRGLTVRSMQRSTPLGVFLRRELALSPETAFGCLHRALYDPSDTLFAVAPSVAHAHQRLLAAAPAVRVGLQVRMGDAIFAYATLATVPADLARGHRDRLRQMVRCAIRVADRAPLLFLVTDSIVVRDEFLRLDLPAGAERLVATHDPANHISPLKSPSANRRSSSIAVAEHMLLSMADVWVISTYSGFGATAAMRSTRANGRVYYGDTDDCKQATLHDLGERA